MSVEKLAVIGSVENLVVVGIVLMLGMTCSRAISLPVASRLFKPVNRGQLGIVTSLDRDSAKEALLNAGLKPDVVISAEDVVFADTHPAEGLRLAAQRLGLKPKHCACVGYAQRGLFQATLWARMRCVAVGPDANILCADLMVPTLEDLVVTQGSGDRLVIRRRPSCYPAEGEPSG